MGSSPGVVIVREWLWFMYDCPRHFHGDQIVRAQANKEGGLGGN